MTSQGAIVTNGAIGISGVLFSSKSLNYYEEFKIVIPLYCNTLYTEKQLWEKWIFKNFVDKDSLSFIISPCGNQITKLDLKFSRIGNIITLTYNIILPKIFFNNSSSKLSFFANGIPNRFKPLSRTDFTIARRHILQYLLSMIQN